MRKETIKSLFTIQINHLSACLSCNLNLKISPIAKKCFRWVHQSAKSNFSCSLTRKSYFKDSCKLVKVVMRENLILQMIKTIWDINIKYRIWGNIKMEM